MSAGSGRGQSTFAYQESKTFERKVAELYARLGYKEVVHDKIVDGSQIDVYAIHELPDGSKVRYIVECKNYSGSVGVQEINKFGLVFKNLHYAGKIDKGVIVSKSGFTSLARQAAESYGIELRDFQELSLKADKEGVLPKEAAPVRETRPKEKYVFVLMPFDEQFDDIYWFGIRGAVEDVSLRCERVDEIHFTGGVMEKVLAQISIADIIIAEMTGRDPNVFYEVGIAHTLEKETVLIVQNAEDIPFDLRGKNHIVYEGKIKLLREKLSSALQTLVST
jgi:nucleoside 2-deoxyribosyltransferase